ncbi:MAG: hypothetical protein QOJ13_2759 [Gaiellales bacterium]|jgi:class 3 adenylate cyclase|nr:hypothetical protein [Gaiellales bacterium]
MIGAEVPANELHYRWDWNLASSPEAVWPFAADTNRFNRDTGVPSVDVLRSADTQRSPGSRRLRLRRFGVAVEWEEEPFEWAYPRRFGVVRRYVRGPLAEMQVAAELEHRDDGGTRLAYEVWALPRRRLWTPLVALQIGVLSRRRFGQAFERYGELAAGKEPPDQSHRLPAGGRDRLDRSREALAGSSSPALADRLAELIAHGNDLELDRIRPYALADAWGEARPDVLELCLHATEVGLLDLRWELLCPLCRGAEQRFDHLADISREVHCESCGIDFTVSFDRSVEITFRPNPSVRPVEARVFCVGGPRVTPHIVAQQLLAPGEMRVMSVELERGAHRLRAARVAGICAVRVDGSGSTSATLALRDEGWPDVELQLTPSTSLSVTNETSEQRLVVLERTAWSDQAATAAHVTVLQLFRDLFSREALRPGEPISVGSLTVLFTDLRGSTRFYREIGDAPAFGRVIEHIGVLREMVAEQGGAVVKTMGDAVMAVFPRPVAAVRAAVEAQRSLAEALPETVPLVLKVGIHHGHCIAIGQNDRLDYFGSTVNATARLVGLSTGTDVVVSGTVHADPEIQAAVAAGEFECEPFTAELRGFEGETFPLWRIRPGAGA